jgi:hypothetical protein
MTPWAEERGLRARGQASFCHCDHRAIDHLFTLRGLIDRAHASKHAFSAAVMDFSKAFIRFRGTFCGKGCGRLGFKGRSLLLFRQCIATFVVVFIPIEHLTDSFERTWGIK